MYAVIGRKHSDLACYCFTFDRTITNCV